MSDASDPSQYNFEAFLFYNEMTYLEWKENYRLERIKRNEVWKDIPDYEGIYQASTLGRVKSLQYGKERILKGGLGGIRRDYLYIVLQNKRVRKTIPIHKVIAITFLNHVPCGHELVVDHINAVKTDNRLCNLQLISNRENVSKDVKNKTSKYTGVCWNKDRKKWIAQITINKKSSQLGYFDDEEKASEAYQRILQHHNNMVVSK